MTMKRIQEFKSKMDVLISEYFETEEKETDISLNEDNPIEMLTIRECTETVKGLSEHTVRQLIAQNKIQYIRTGQGKRGKILVSKSSLLSYLGGVTLFIKNIPSILQRRDKDGII